MRKRRKCPCFSSQPPPPKHTQNAYNLQSLASFNGSHTNVCSVTPGRSDTCRAAGADWLCERGALQRQWWSWTFHLLAPWRNSSPLDWAECFLVLGPNHGSVTSVCTGGLAVKRWVRRCGGHTGIGFEALKNVSKESVTDDFLVVVVSLHCESDDRYC